MHKLVIDAKAVLQMLFVFVLSVPVFAVNPDNVVGTQSATVARYTPGQDFTISVAVTFTTAPGSLGIAIALDDNDGTAGWSYRSSTTGLTDEDQNPVPFPVKPSTGATAQPFNFGFIEIPNSPINMTFKFRVPNDFDDTVTIRTTVKGTSSIAGGSVPYSELLNTLTILPPVPPNVTVITPSTTFLDEDDITVIAASTTNSVTAGQPITFTATVAPSTGQTLTTTFISVGKPVYANGMWNESSANDALSPTFLATGNIDIPFANTSPASGGGHAFSWTTVTTQTAGERTFTWTPGASTVTKATPQSDRVFLAQIFAIQNNGGEAKAAWAIAINPVNAVPVISNQEINGNDESDGVFATMEGASPVFTFRVTDNDKDTLTVQFRADGEIEEDLTQTIVLGTETFADVTINAGTIDFTEIQHPDISDTVTVEIVVNDGDGGTATFPWQVTIADVNQPPTQTGGSVAITPDPAFTETTLTATVSGATLDDLDAEDVASLKYLYTWFRNDDPIQEVPAKVATTDTLDKSLFAEDDEIRCEVAIVDQLGLESTGLITDTVTISNTAPAGADGKIIVSTGLTKQQQLVGTDDDNNDGGASDTLSFAIRKGLQANFRANLTGGSEVPAVTTTATGIGVFVLDADNDKLFYYVRYENLSSAESSAHIHGLADVGAEADPLHSLPTGNPKWGVWDYSGGAGTLDAAAIETGIQGGMMYVNIHSSDHTGGEIRGQIVATTIPANVTLGVSDAGLMSFDPRTKNAVGSAMNGDFFAFTYGINDGTDDAVSKLIVLEVLDNLPPTIASASPNVTPNPAVVEGGDVAFAIDVTDVTDPAESLRGIKRVEWFLNGESKKVDTGTAINLASTYTFATNFDTISSANGTHPENANFTVRVVGTDTQDATVDRSWTVQVSDNNRAPTIASVSLTVQGGESAFEASTLVAAPKRADGSDGADDADNDTVTFTYAWLVNGALVEGQTTSMLTGAHFNKGNSIVARATPNNARDDDAVGVAVDSASVTILNTPPVVTSPLALGVTDKQTNQIDLKNVANSTDADGDTLTYSIASGAPTLGQINLNASTGVFAFTANTALAAELDQGETSPDAFQVRANDGTANSNAANLVVTVTGVNDNPTADDQSGLFSKTNDVELTESTEPFSLSGDDVDGDDTPTNLTFKLVAGFESKGVFKNQAGNTIAANAVIAQGDLPIRFFPAVGTRGLVRASYVAIDPQDGVSEEASIRIAVGTPPWFPFIDLLEFDATAANGGSYRVVIKQGNTEKANIAVRTDANKTSVDPVDYIASGSKGMVTGDYTVAVSKFVSGSFSAVGVVEALTVDEYDNPVVNSASRNPIEGVAADGNYDFSFDLDSVSGWQLDITRSNPNTFMRQIRREIQPDADGVVLISGMFHANDVFLSEPGTYTWKVTPFNPNVQPGDEDSVPLVRANDIVVTAAVQPTAAPSAVAVSGMSPGTSDPENPETAGVATVANGSAAAVTFEWDGVGSVDRYFVYVESLSGSIIVNAEQVPAGNTSLGPKQIPAGTYRWHVIARNTRGFSTWSSARYFQVESDPLANVPVIASFTRTAQTLNTSVTFTVTWETQGDEIELILFKLDTNQLFHGVFDVSESSTVTVTRAIAGFNPAVPDVTYRFQAVPFKNGVEGQASQLGSYLLRNAEATTQLQTLELTKVNASLRISGLGTGSPERIKFDAYRLSLTNPALGMVAISTTTKTVSAEMRTAGEVTVPLNEISSQLTATGFLISIRAQVEKGSGTTLASGAFSEPLIFLNQ